MAISKMFADFAGAVAHAAGRPLTFAASVGVIIAWALTGPLFGFSDTWQLIINTSTTIVTFLMVFLIQRTQNKDALAIHLKLNELVAAVEGASNRVVDIEALTEKELQALERHYGELARLAGAEADLTKSHSVEEARTRHTAKRRSLKES